jgi:hypothetical protein
VFFAPFVSSRFSLASFALKKQGGIMEILAVAILACGAWAVTAAVLIARDLSRRGVPVRFLWLRLTILRHLHQYRELTREETGRTGPLFYHYVVPLNLALVLALFGLLHGVS